jgi:archaellum component FlaF (FlaF/FlaG flagellin family)
MNLPCDTIKCADMALRNIDESVEKAHSETVEGVSQAQLDTVKVVNDVHRVIETCHNFVNSTDNGQEIVSMKVTDAANITLISNQLTNSHKNHLIVLRSYELKLRLYYILVLCLFTRL